MPAVLERQRSQALDVENYKEIISSQAIGDDIISYLGEYRFKLPKFNYQLTFSNGEVRDKEGNSMLVKAERAIEQKKSRGKPTYREIAEAAGLHKLSDQLQNANHGDTLFWASPPGPRAEGYGNYGFIYSGKVEKEGSKTRLVMTAIRVENPTLNQFSKAFELLTKQKIAENAECFLENPVVVDWTTQEAYTDEVLRNCFSYRDDNTIYNKFRSAMVAFEPMIKSLIDSIKARDTNKSLINLHVLENMAIEYKKSCESNRRDIFVSGTYRQMSPKYLVERYGYNPPTVLGSCGSSGGVKSNQLGNFNFENFINSLSEQEWFKCECGWQASGPIGDGPCGGCGLTKEKAKEMGKAVC